MSSGETSSQDASKGAAQTEGRASHCPGPGGEHFGAAAFIGFYSSSHSSALGHGWLLGSPQAPVQGARLCFLPERALRVSVVAPFPAHADSQPRASRNELPTASCWEMARTGLLSLPGRLSVVHGKGHSEHCAPNQSLPWTCSLSPQWTQSFSLCAGEAGPAQVFSQEKLWGLSSRRLSAFPYLVCLRQSSQRFL